MLQVALPFAAVVLVGLGIAVETPTNAFLTRTSSSALWAALVSFLVGAAILLVAYGVTRPKLADGWAAHTPWWAWTGGAYGAVLVLLSAWATPKLGAGTTLVVIVASQVALGVALDHWGALGLERHPAGWLRMAGVAMVAGGALMVARG